MDELEKLKVLIEAELAPYKENMNQIVSETKRMSFKVTKETKSIKNSFVSMGKAIKTALLGFAGYKLVQLGKQALNFASDVEETESVVDLAFGNMRKYIDDFAKHSIRTHGMSAQSAKAAAGDYMLMSQGMGLADGAAAQMAVNVTKLSADMASLKNTSQEMAKTALNSIWTGETIALRKYGIVLTQNNLQEFAARQGIQKKLQQMTQQEQVMLRYAYVMDAMRLAQGNFQREYQGFAAQTKMLGEQWKEFLQLIGQGLTVVLLPVIRFINKLMSYLIAFAKLLSGVFRSIFGLKSSAESSAKSIEPVNNSFGGISDNLNDIGSKGVNNLNNLGKSAEKAGKKAKGSLASFDELNVLTKETADTLADTEGNNGIGGLGGSSINIPVPDVSGFKDLGIGDVDTSWIDKYVDYIQKGLNKVKGFFDEHKAIILAAIAGIVSGIITAINGTAIISALKPIWFALTHPISALEAVCWSLYYSINLPFIAITTAVTLITSAVVYLWNTSDSFRESVIDTWNRIKDLIVTVFEGVKNTLIEFWYSYSEPIMQSLSIAWQRFVDLVDSLWQGVLKPIVDGIIEGLKILWENVLQPLFKFVLNTTGDIILLLLELWNSIISPFLKFLVDKFGPHVEAVVNAFVEIWRFASSAIKPIINGITDTIDAITIFLQGLINFVKKIFLGDWTGAWEIVSKAASNAWEIITNLFSKVWEWFSDNVTTPIVNVFTSAWDNIKEYISDIWDSILSMFTKGGTFFSGIAESIGGVFVSIVNGLISGINWVIAKPFDFLNGMLNSISGISILGAKPFGWIGHNPLPVPQIPYLDVGTNYVARDGIAMIHEGEAVVPKKYNPAAGGNLDQVELLKEQNNLLRMLLEKDNSVYLDGDKLHQSNEKRKKEQYERFGYSF